MNLRNLIDKLDSLNEAGSTDLKLDFVKKKEHLFSLLKQLRDVANKTEPNTAALQTSTQPINSTPSPAISTPPTNNIQDLRNKAAELTKAGDVARAKIYTDTANRLAAKQTQSTIHSDVSNLATQDPDIAATRRAFQESNFASELINSFNETPITEETGFIKKVGGKFLLPLAVASEMWDAWTKIQELPDDMPIDKKKAEVARIIGSQVARYGVFTVGAALGALIGGTIGGPLALVTGIAGGIAAEHEFGDNVDQLVNWAIDKLYDQDVPDQKDATQEPDNADDKIDATINDMMSSVTREMQTNLNSAGINLGKAGIDGIFGPATISALKSYKEKINAASDLDAILKLINLEEEVVKETFNMAELKNKLVQLDEIKVPKIFKAKTPKAKTPNTPANTPITADTLNRIKAKLESLSPNVKRGFSSFSRIGSKAVNLLRFSKFSVLIAALAAAGYYLWDSNGNLEMTNGTDIPAPGAGALPSSTTNQQKSCSKEVETLVNQIHVAILQLKMFNDPTIVPDARNAIVHAEKTLQLYAPGC